MAYNIYVSGFAEGGEPRLEGTGRDGSHLAKATVQLSELPGQIWAQVFNEQAKKIMEGAALRIVLIGHTVQLTCNEGMVDTFLKTVEHLVRGCNVPADIRQQRAMERIADDDARRQSAERDLKARMSRFQFEKPPEPK